MSSILNQIHGEAQNKRVSVLGRIQASMAVDPLPLATETVTILTACIVAGLTAPVLTTVAATAISAIAGAYRPRLTLSVLDIGPRVAVSSAAGAFAVRIGSGLTEVGKLLAGTLIVCAAALLGRTFAYEVERRMRRTGQLCRRTAVIGMGAVASALTERMLAEPECGLRPVAFLDEATESGPITSPDLPVHPVNGDLRLVLERLRIDTAIIAFPRLASAQLLEMAWDCRQSDCEIFVVPRLWEAAAVGGDMERIGAIPLSRIGGPDRHRLGWSVKLAADRCLAGAALIMLSPLLVLISVAVFCSDRSAPVLFRQRRIGLNGHEFELLKFRSLRPANDLEQQTTWTIAGDPRLSRFGRLLRASSLDELPQLWNVLRGDMVLVGPRPERPHFVEAFSASIPGYRARHRVPVGLTGWAAVNGLRGDTSIAERARYDNFYINNWSLWLDIKIIIRTGWALVVNFQQDRSAARSTQTEDRVVARKDSIPRIPPREVFPGRRNELSA